MSHGELIGLINLTMGVLATQLVFSYAAWVYRDRRSLLRISAGLLVFVLLGELAFRGYEGFYYGFARLLDIEGINVRNDQPWVYLIGLVKTSGVVLLLLAYAAKKRADGMRWYDVIRSTSLFALEGALVMIALYLMFVK